MSPRDIAVAVAGGVMSVHSAAVKMQTLMISPRSFYAGLLGAAFGSSRVGDRLAEINDRLDKRIEKLDKRLLQLDDLN
jgi:hypothetical protein